MNPLALPGLNGLAAIVVRKTITYQVKRQTFSGGNHLMVANRRGTTFV
jgi:hypothetical protein